MSVDIQLVLTPARLREWPGLSEAAIQDAISRAIPRIEEVAMTETPVGDPTNYGYTSTGRSPGTLKASFDIGRTPRSIVFGWSAIYLGEDYAKIVETGVRTRNPFPARNYAAATSQRALEIILEELKKAFEAI